MGTLPVNPHHNAPQGSSNTNAGKLFGTAAVTHHSHASDDVRGTLCAHQLSLSWAWPAYIVPFLSVDPFLSVVPFLFVDEEK